LQYKLSLRNVAEMFLTRGFTFTHETVRAWEERLAPLLTAQLKAKRRGKAGRTWHVDETYVKVEGRWCYLYRAIDSDGTLVETMLSKTRDMAAAKRFFTCALKAVGQAPEKVTTDGHDSYLRAVRETLGPDVRHRTSRYMNNRIEQDHRGIKQRYYPMRGFGSSMISGVALKPASRGACSSCWRTARVRTGCSGGTRAFAARWRPLGAGQTMAFRTLRQRSSCSTKPRRLVTRTRWISCGLPHILRLSAVSGSMRPWRRCSPAIRGT